MKKLLAIFLLACAFFLTHAQIITTIAGNGTAGYSGDGGQATAAELNYPQTVVISATGNYYISDRNNNVIRKVDVTGKISTVAGNGTAGYSGDGGQATAAELNLPTGVSVDISGNTYIADSRNNVIRKVDATGKISTIAGNGIQGYSGDGGPATDAELYQPATVNFDASGNMYILDKLNNVIRKVDATGKITTIAGNGIAGFSGDGGQATAAELNYPTIAEFDKNGNLFVADDHNNVVRRVNSSGIITTVAGNHTAGYSGDGGQATAAELYASTGVLVDTWDNLYIAERLNNVVRKVDNSGIITTITGNGTAGYSGDGGQATAAELNGPITVASDGYDMLIVDNNNNVVRKISNVLSFVQPYDDAGAVTLYPNPNHGAFTLQWSVASGQLPEKNTVEIYNMLGEKIYSSQYPILNSQYQINLGSNPAGIYMYRVISENCESVATGKFVIEK